MQIYRDLQFPVHDGNFSGFTSNINNGYPSNNETNMMNGGGLDSNIRSSNDVRVASNYVPPFESKNENLTTQVSNANLISSSNNCYISEFSSILNFLDEWEKFVVRQIQKLRLNSQLIRHPIIEKLAEILTLKILELYVEQFVLSFRYHIEKLVSNTFLASNMDHPYSKPRYIVLNRDNKYICSCLVFQRGAYFQIDKL